MAKPDEESPFQGPATRVPYDLIPTLDAATFAGTEPPRQSPFEALLEAVETHIHEESQTVVEYERVASTTHDPVIAMLLQLVIDDEGRHHDLMRRIAADLRNGLYWTHTKDALPDSGWPPPVDPPEILEDIHRFALQERLGVREMQTLARDSSRMREGLDSLLLELMAIDSQKHERVMQYIKQRIEESRRMAGERS